MMHLVAAPDALIERALGYIRTKRLTKEAPGIRLVVEKVLGPSFSRLEGGDIDLLLSFSDRRLYRRGSIDGDLVSEDLFSESFVCVVDGDHPVGEQMSLADFSHYPSCDG
jgi:LysR family transcriptional regulator, nod-box dependent transcriptional activator